MILKSNKRSIPVGAGPVNTHALSKTIGCPLKFVPNASTLYSSLASRSWQNRSRYCAAYPAPHRPCSPHGVPLTADAVGSEESQLLHPHRIALNLPVLSGWPLCTRSAGSALFSRTLPQSLQLALLRLINTNKG